MNVWGKAGFFWFYFPERMNSVDCALMRSKLHVIVMVSG